MLRVTNSFFLIFVSILNYGCTFRSGFFLTNNCSCPGHNLTFECSVNGIVEGSTVWSGNALRQCTVPVPIFLRHREFRSTLGTSGVCNNGDIVIHSLRADSSCYTSQMNILFSANLNGSTVACAYDNGTATVGVGSMSIMAGINKAYPPPTGIHLMSANRYQLTFAWNPVTPECSAIHYNIFATNCGVCPSRTHHDSVACTDYSVSTQAQMCSFVLQTVFCEDGTMGTRSDPVQVTLKVLRPPLVETIVYRYSYSTGDVVGFMVQFSAVPSFAISDGVAIDGSAVSYTLAYNDSISGVSCGSATVPASSCVDGVCQHSFTYEESACSSPSIGVNVTISAANVLGSGPASYPNTVEDQTNKFVSVTFDLVTNSIVCNFHNQGQILSGSKKFCSIDYGPEGESCSSYSQTSHGTSDVVRIGLPLQLSSTGQYCFSVTGNNGTYTAVVEGTFKPGRVNVTHAYGISLGLSLTFVILVGSGVITTLVVIIVFLARAYKKVQVQLVKVQTVKVSTPISTAPTRAVLKPNSNRIYEELDGDGTNEVLDVENLAYPTKDFHRSRCSTPCSGDSGEAEDAYYSTI